MFLINLMILPLPALLAMLGMWVNVIRLDSLPEDSFADIRHAKLMCLLSLILVIVFIGTAIYQVPKFVELAAMVDQITGY